MPSEGPSSAPLPSTRPSVFLSYASEDRGAARALCDTMRAAGLEVWFDESELGGGDAWDQKIRKQIRDCDYFMPLISATTERRKEGYFRREWRLAAERTMDMADDVLFLLPIVIDDTPDAGARVPEKFTAVQWLRTPAGQRTPALDALIQRLLAGDHTATPRPPLLSRPTVPAATTNGKTARDAETPPPPPQMPPFPHAPHDGRAGHWCKFIAEILWWGLTAAWSLFFRLPRWLRIVLTVWLVVTLFGPCRNTTTPKPKAKEKAAAAAKPNVDVGQAAVDHVAEAIAKNPDIKDWAKIGEDLARRFGTAIAADKRLLVVPIAAAPENAPDTQFAQRVFSACYGKLLITRPGEADLMPALPRGTDDAALAAAAREKRAAFVLLFHLPPASENAATLSARLLRASDGTVAWREDFPVIASEVAQTAEKIATAVLAALPAK